MVPISHAVSAFSDTLGNSAGKATLKEVTFSITDVPQITKAEIAEVIAPEEIMPGESVTLSVVLVPHWSTAGDERTIKRTITLEVPEDFPTGEANINVSSDTDDVAGLFEGILDLDLDLDEEEEKPVPKNLDELIAQMLEDQVDPGLITVTLTPSDLGEDILADLEDLLPEGFPHLDGLPIPEDVPEDAEQSSVEAEFVLDGFIVTGSRKVTVLVKGEDAALLPAEIALPEGFAAPPEEE